ncbi:unnamed protein product [Brassica oleracea]|uniref:NPH3 domain-containing protein n=1 Tax=Brassica oleracea TaxID=3712 RepID=A0A3P6FJ90_BRAOL|nr:unnamed protein product [Brassica oleracea]
MTSSLGCFTDSLPHLNTSFLQLQVRVIGSHNNVEESRCRKNCLTDCARAQRTVLAGGATVKSEALKVHQMIDKTQRKRLCRILDCNKLSVEASKQACCTESAASIESNGIEDPMTPPDLVGQIHDEIDEEAPPSAVVLLPASVPLTVAAASVVNIVAGDNEIGEEAADEHETDEEVGDDDSDKGPTFVRSLGAWSKPLHFTPPPTPPEPATPRFEATEMLQSQIDSFWPSIGEVIVNGPKKKGHLFPKNSVTQMPVDKIPPQALKEDGSLRFPWAARMNQSSRNLFRATEPTYQLNGTPQVTIPSKVLKLGPENKEEYVVEQFHRCSSPPGGLIHVVLNRLWGRQSANVAPSHSPIMEVIPSHSIILEEPSSSANEQ